MKKLLKFIPSIIAGFAVLMIGAGLAMATGNFPTSLNNFSAGGSFTHGDANAIEAKIGADNSVVVTSLDYITKSASSSLGSIRAVATTTGNILCANGTVWVGKTIGSNGKLLTASSTATCGVSWETLSGYLQSANNLSELTSTSTARTNLGLTDTATLASSTWLKVANNGSDINSASTFRTNLGLTDTATLASSTWLKITGGTLTGHLLFTDNTYDIGASGATRPRTGYFGTSVITPSITATGSSTIPYLNYTTATGTTATIATLNSTTGSITTLSGTGFTYTNGTSTNFNFTTATGTSANITTITGTTATITNTSATNATSTNQSVTTLYFGNSTAQNTGERCNNPFIIENATTSENLTMAYFGTTSTLTKVRTLNKNVGDTMTFQLRYGLDRTAVNDVFTAYQTANSTTTWTTHTINASSTPQANSGLFLITTSTAASASSSQFSVAVCFTNP